MSQPGPAIAAVALSHSPQMGQDAERGQGTVFRDGYARVVKAVADYAPTLVVCFGPDHLRALAGLAPCFTVVEAAAGWGDWGTPQEDYRVPTELAVALGEHLAASGIDIALAPHLRLDHGFGQSTADIFGSLSAVPLIPIVINCVDRPIPTAARCAALGSAVGDFIRSRLPSEERVLLIGSGGMSHQPPSLVPGARDLSEAERRQLIADKLDQAVQAMNPAWDQRFLSMLSSREWTRLAGLTSEDLAPGGAGGAEVRTWVAAAFAAGVPLSPVVYEPVKDWITGMGIAVSDELGLN